MRGYRLGVSTLKTVASLTIVFLLAPATFADTVVYVALAIDKKIAAYRMNPEDGKLSRIDETALDGEPGALTVDPNRRFLFASLRAEGKLAAFRIDAKTGKLTHINTVLAGPDPAHLSTDKDGRYLFCAYYVAAKVTVHRIGKDGSLGAKPHQSINTAEKAHAILLDPSNRFAFVPHTGPNAIFQFTFDAKLGELKPATVAKLMTPENTGPRHIVFHPSTFTDAGISSTCSTTGAFRLAKDVLAKGPVDLFFIEFAVNDDQDAGHARRECIRGMEGIVRQALAHNPNMDIVITYFVNPSMLKTIQDGKTPLTIGSHEQVARHYHVSTINLAQEVADRILGGTLTWKQYGGVHPDRPGNELCASMIAGLLNAAWKEPLPKDAIPTPHRLPDQPVDADHYGNGRFIDPNKAMLGKGWAIETPDWKKLPGSCRERFRAIPLLCATEPGADLTLKFEGKAVGAYLLAGPDAGAVEVSIDGGPITKIDLFHRFSQGLHYPRTVLFASDLKPGAHKLKLRIASEPPKDTSRTALRIIQFVAN